MFIKMRKISENTRYSEMENKCKATCENERDDVAKFNNITDTGNKSNKSASTGRTALDDEEDILFNFIIGRLVDEMKDLDGDCLQFEFYSNYRLEGIGRVVDNSVASDLVFENEDNPGMQKLKIRCKMFFCLSHTSIDCDIKSGE